MSNFEKQLAKIGKQYLLTEAQLGINPQAEPSLENQNPGQTGIDQVQSETPPTDQSPEVKPLTVEGKRYLIELALHALAFDPDEISESDKGLFNEEVTVQNAEEILQRIQNLVDQNSGS